MTERVMIFIDGSNLYHSLKNHFNRADLDLGKFTAKLLNKRQLVRTYYYNAMVGQKQEPEVFKQQQAFFNGVNALPYTELRLGRLVYSSGWPNVPPTEKGTDVQLAVDMITHAYKDNYDVAILVAGDNDFTGAVQASKDSGKHVEIALFGNPGTSQQLRDVADLILSVDGKLLKDCWARQPRQRRSRRQETAQPMPQAQPENEPAPEPQPQPEAAAEQPAGEAAATTSKRRRGRRRRKPEAKPETAQPALEPAGSGDLPLP
jgi:uncharacterized LabA/DUF88 family protein